MPIIIVNDLHFTDTPPAPRSGDYLKDLLRKLLEVRKLQESLPGAMVLGTGDIFHRKTPERVSHKLVALVLRAIAPLKMSTIVGNHDMTGSQIDSHLRHPIGVLFASGLVGRLERTTTQFSTGCVVEILGFDYDEQFEKGKKTIDVGPKTTEHRILLTHSMMEPQHRNQIKGEFDWCFYGHVHRDEGISGKFVSHGALMRVRNADWDVDRKPAVTLLRDDMKVEKVVLNSTRPWDDVKAAVKVKAADEEDPFEEFVTALQAGVAKEQTTIEDVLKELDPPVRQKVEQYIGVV